MKTLTVNGIIVSRVEYHLITRAHAYIRLAITRLTAIHHSAANDSHYIVLIVRGKWNRNCERCALAFFAIEKDNAAQFVYGLLHNV